MKKKLLSLVALVLVLGLTVVGLSGCGEKTTTITVFNCFDYIDEKVLEMFTAETGIKVTYTNYTSNEEMYAKMENGSGTYDVIFPSDYMVERRVFRRLHVGHRGHSVQSRADRRGDHQLGQPV